MVVSSRSQLCYFATLVVVLLASHVHAQSTVWVTHWDFCDDQLSTWYSPNNYVVSGCRNEGSTSVQMSCQTRSDGDRVVIKDYSTPNCAGASVDGWVPEGVCIGHNGNWVRYSCDAETIAPDMFSSPVSAGDIVGYKTKWTGQCGTSEFAPTGINPEPMYRCTVLPGDAGVIRRDCRIVFESFKIGSQTDYPTDCAATVDYDETYTTGHCYLGTDGLFYSYSCEYPTITPPSPPPTTPPFIAPIGIPSTPPQSAPQLEPSTPPQSDDSPSSSPQSSSEPEVQSPYDDPITSPTISPTLEPQDEPSSSDPSSPQSNSPASSPQSDSQPDDESPTSTAIYLSLSPFSLAIGALFVATISL